MLIRFLICTAPPWRDLKGKHKIWHVPSSNGAARQEATWLATPIWAMANQDCLGWEEPGVQAIAWERRGMAVMELHVMENLSCRGEDSE